MKGRSCTNLFFLPYKQPERRTARYTRGKPFYWFPAVRTGAFGNKEGYLVHTHLGKKKLSVIKLGTVKPSNAIAEDTVKFLSKLLHFAR